MQIHGDMVAKIRIPAPRYTYRLWAPKLILTEDSENLKPQLPEGNNYRTESRPGPNIEDHCGPSGWLAGWLAFLADCMMTMLKTLIKGTSEIKAFHNCSKARLRRGLEFREIEISFSIRPAIYQMLLSIAGFWSLLEAQLTWSWMSFWGQTWGRNRWVRLDKRGPTEIKERKARFNT